MPNLGLVRLFKVFFPNRESELNVGTGVLYLCRFCGEHKCHEVTGERKREDRNGNEDQNFKKNMFNSVICRLTSILYS